MGQTKYTSPVAVHPGELIKEWLESSGMTSREFALRTGKPEKTISHILNGKSAIMKDVADSFEIVTGIPADYILRFQAEYEADVARLSRIDPMEALWDSFGELFPYSQMVKTGWIVKDRTKADKMRGLLSFFGLTSEQAFTEAYTTIGVAYRHTGRASRTPYAVAAWVRQGQILASRQERPETVARKEVITSRIPELKDALKIGDLPLLVSLCAEIGVKLVFVENLPSASISGAAYQYGGSPVIQLSGKGKTLDKLTYNFFHELGHIYYGHKGILVDDIDEATNTDEEKQADAFATKVLYGDLKHFDHAPSRSEIITEADRVGVSPCVVLGHLAYIGLISYQEASTRYRSLQKPFEIDFEAITPR